MPAARGFIITFQENDQVITVLRGGESPFQHFQANVSLKNSKETHHQKKKTYSFEAAQKPNSLKFPLMYATYNKAKSSQVLHYNYKRRKKNENTKVQFMFSIKVW